MGDVCQKLQTKIRFQTIAQILVWHSRTRNIVHKSFETHLWSFKVLLKLESLNPDTLWCTEKSEKSKAGSDMRDKKMFNV